jgi:hypothetical protein
LSKPGFKQILIDLGLLEEVLVFVCVQELLFDSVAGGLGGVLFYVHPKLFIRLINILKSNQLFFFFWGFCLGERIGLAFRDLELLL